MRMGKHVCCEKPLTHSVHESRVLAQLDAEKKVAMQMGTQMHASGNYRRAIEILRAGAIGTVRELDMWAAGGERHGEQPTPYSTKVQKGRPTDAPPVPPTLNWDLWIGPAPMRPYHPCYLPREWHFWWDFGGGELGNVGCHHLDMPFWALELRHPKTIEAEGDLLNPERTPGGMSIKYEFAARGELPPLKFTWYWGQSSPRIKGQNVEEWPLCYLFVGDKGMMAVSPQEYVLLPEDKFAD